MIYVIRQNKVSQMLTAILLAVVSIYVSAEVTTDGTLGAAQSLSGAIIST